MKIVTWNCNGALRKKLEEVDSLGADLLLIQECENPESSSGHYRDWAGDYLWLGNDKNKGIGVFPRNGNNVSRLNWYGEFKINAFKRSHRSHSWSTADLKLFLPFKFNDNYTILGVWTKGSDSEVFGYMGQFWKYLQIHDEDLSKPNTLIVGDFNSNAIWDKSDRWWSHSGVIGEIAELDIYSLYHHRKNEDQGSESKPTFYLHRNKNRSYHIDYAFVSEDLLNSSDIEIGSIGDWLPLSDHMPITITISS